MKILVGCPVLFNGETCLKAFKSVIDEADLLILDNGADQSVKDAIIEMARYNDNRQRIALIRNETNQFVVPAWNTLLGAFLDPNCPYEQLVIMNSDLILQPGWSQYLENNISVIPCDGTLKKDEEVFNGTPGIFITLNKAMAKAVYPIPNEIKLWFSDQWIYTILREIGYKTIVKHKLIGLHFHGGSQTIGILPNKSEMIEADKIAWAEVVEPLMWERIAELKKA
jgi:hypothetical protein